MDVNMTGNTEENTQREQNLKTAGQLFSFIQASPSPFHAVANMKRELDAHGYAQLLEGEEWRLEEEGKYYVIRNGSALIAFRIPKRDFLGFQIMASHSDSPSFKIKENPEMDVEGHYVKLNVEKYGGMLCAPWFDRPLSVAGRVIIREGSRLVTRLVNVDRDLCMIPSLAIHMNRGGQRRLQIQCPERHAATVWLRRSRGKVHERHRPGSRCRAGGYGRERSVFI